MKISDITIDLIKEHCGISGDDSNALIEVYKDAALAQICAYTGLTAAELDGLEDIAYAFLAIVGEMFSVREMTVEITDLNPMAKQILESHRRNFL